MVYVTLAILFFNLGVSYMQLKYKNLERISKYKNTGGTIGSGSIFGS